MRDEEPTSERQLRRQIDQLNAERQARIDIENRFHRAMRVLIGRDWWFCRLGGDDVQA
jgi:hypothetical protein